ncbi:hypothetical protein PCANC_15585 [Puccinia coronata f. sp. avenae]|uniref:histidine kinase n=1 Tax=Puccinia coronata f. sp. avenae TaxID=200324 RepID=A0A2N5SKD5_9BASI|nr:hypothetical protein PCANC_15585 [Puccinia coronata f. sp. avenae]PLW52248.1 hypothetical protein PCASD_00225 [Puccinia coronata f. sp. avenae]
MSCQDGSSSSTVKPTRGTPSSSNPSSARGSGSFGQPSHLQVPNPICSPTSGSPSQAPSSSVSSAFPFPQFQQPQPAALSHHTSILDPHHFHPSPTRPKVSPIQSKPAKRSATTRPERFCAPLHSSCPAPTQSVSYSADSRPTSQDPSQSTSPCFQSPQPASQHFFPSQPDLESYLSNSPQLVFVIPAHPLYGTLCRRRRVGIFDDPDEHAQFPIDDGAALNTLFQRTVYPHLSPEEGDSGRDVNLSELLSPIYVNPAAEKFAHLILERTKQPDGKQTLNSPSGWYWDIMKLLHHRDLSRWLSWLRGILSNKSEFPTSFKTTLKTSHHFKAPNSSNHPRKRHNREHQSSPSTDDSSTPSVAPPAPEIIMTAQIWNTDPAPHDSSVSDGKITSNYNLIFSAIVLRHPTQPEQPEPPSDAVCRASSVHTADQHSYHLASASQYDKSDGIVYSGDSPHRVSQPTSSEAIRPKRIKTSQTDSYIHQSVPSQDHGPHPTDAPNKHNNSLGSYSPSQAERSHFAPKVNWLDESNAKRLFLKSSRRARPNAGRGLNFPNLNLPLPLQSRWGSVSGRSGLSYESQEGENTSGSSTEPEHTSDKMILDDPWFRELSASNLDNNTLASHPVSDYHKHSSASTRQLDSKPLDELMSSKEQPNCSSFSAQSSFDNNAINQVQSDLSLIAEKYVDQNQNSMSETKSQPLQGPSKSVISSARSSRSDSFSSSSSLSTRHPREAADDLFRQALMASPTGRLILEMDWGNTPIGPMEYWSPTLRSMVTLILASPYRMSLLWGDDCVMLYNDAYVRTCRLKHPSLLGQSGAHGWAELWADLGEIADSVLQGDVYTVYDSLLFVDRDPDNPNGIRKEESYHSFSWIPVRGPTGEVEGILNPSFETTLRVIAERRLSSLRDLVQITLMSRNRVSYQERCLESFAKNPYDLPFVIMYSCEAKKNSRRGPTSADENASETSGCWINLQLKLAGTIGVPKGHFSAAEQIRFNIQIHASNSQAGGSAHSSSTLGHSADNKSRSPSSAESQLTMHTELTEDDSVVWPLREACTFRKPIYVAHLGDRAKGFETRGWPDQTRSAVVMPISTSDDSPPLGVIVFGLSPRLNWTESYALFLNLLTRQFSTGLSTVIGHEEEAQRLEELAALDRAKTTFFTNISHELRTPLTLIVGPISMILESAEISSAARERLKIVERNTQRLINLVNQLLDLSRFEAGKMVARFRGTDVSKLTANLAALFRSAMHKNEIGFIVDCPDTNRRVWVDQDFFEKIVFNILSNSMKFTPKGGKVILEVRYDSANCYLICSDTGRGIAPEELPRIFERFHRAEDSHVAEGTGIGLALVQDIVKLHDGRLGVESEIGRGSKFTITFRLGVAHLPPDSLDLSTESAIDQSNDRVIASNARRWILGEVEPIRALLPDRSPGNSDSSSSRGSTDPNLSSMNEGVLSTAGSTVLIADDNADMRVFLKSVLSRYYNVVEAVDAHQAFQWAKLHRPDILVSDVMMPGMDGFELLRRLKADSDTAAMSVILLSARAGSESRVEGLAKGADDYLVKPFEAKELVARVNTHLQIAKMRQRLEGAVATRTQLLKENEQKYRDLYHTFEVISMLSPVGIFQLSPDGHITFANNAFRSQCKLTSAEPLSRWMSCIHSLDRTGIEDTFELSIRARQPSKGEFRWKDGSWCFYELTPYYKEDEIFEGYLGSTTDVTERKESEQKQLEAAEARARDAEESKRQQEAFIDMTSHEIRNPLHGIHQAAELLYSSLKFLYGLAQNNHQIAETDLVQFRNELREDIDAIESIQLCASHQSRIADDIINVSKLSMGLLTTIKTDFDLVDRVREVLSMYLIEAQQKSVELKLQIGEGLDNSHYICADPNRLAQVIINFLSNALRYTSNSEGPKSVTVRVDIFSKCPEPRPNVRRIGSLRAEVETVEPEDLVFAKVGVQDTARGLSPEELSKLFSRFVQANPTQDQYGGSGLGLYVSHRLIENHGGFIEVMSTKGQGSVFSFVIPTKRSVRPPITSSGSHSHRGKRGFTRAINEEEVVEMQPASALLPGGTIAAGGGISSRLASPDIHSIPITDHHFSRPERVNHQQLKDENVIMTACKSSGSTAVTKRHQTGSQPTHVLVVEDNTINVKVIKRQLTQKGYMVSVAMDGREALNRLYADASETSGCPSIDIVLMDIQMPVMDGLEAITHLRAAEKNGEIKKRYPVIAVTGNARKEQTEQCLASGFDSICVKPYKIDDVQSRMEALLANLEINDN